MGFDVVISDWLPFIIKMNKDEIVMIGKNSINVYRKSLLILLMESRRRKNRELFIYWDKENEKKAEKIIKLIKRLGFRNNGTLMKVKRFKEIEGVR